MASTSPPKGIWAAFGMSAIAVPIKVPRTPAPRYVQEWLFDPHRNGGGVLVDYCCYGANLASVLLRHPQSVTGFTGTLTKPFFPLEDNATLIVRYEDAMATLEGSWSQIGKPTSYVTTIHGTTGTFLIEP